MTKTESVTIAKLCQQVQDISKQLDQNTKDTRAIRSALDNLSGGKQALIWVSGFIASAMLVVAAYLGLRKI